MYLVVIGCKIQNPAEQSGLKSVVRSVGSQVAKKTGKIKSEIKKRGGVLTIADGVMQSLFSRIDKGYDALMVQIDKLCQSFEDQFFTDGILDRDKTRRFMKDKSVAVSSYGHKAVDVLSRTFEDATIALKSDFRSYVPSPEERRTIYAGIGTDYQGVLFREHLDACLAFQKKAESALPQHLPFKRQILDDLKASASANTLELLKYYEKKEGESSKKKSTFVNSYLAKSN